MINSDRSGHGCSFHLSARSSFTGSVLTQRDVNVEEMAHREEPTALPDA
jgi:hypothetical protein